MSLYDYKQSQELAKLDPSFDALIMAAVRKADSTNLKILEISFPRQTQELKRRYDAPGGLLPGETD